MSITGFTESRHDDTAFDTRATPIAVPAALCLCGWELLLTFPQQSPS